jgi:hypothetical protein
VPQNFLFPQRDQPLLLPVDMREWLPEDDLVFVVLDAVATLDLGEFRRRYRADGHGRAAFDPEMMVALPRHLDRLPATARAVRRMRHHRGRADYKLRAQTVEPVFGQIKACMKMTAMSRRGFAACRSEWLLAATAHNLRKLHIHRHSA